jgi:ribosomal protein S6--L-glutamate ligase
MKICVLSRNQNLYSTRRLVQAARDRGHDVSVIDTTTVAVEVGVDRRDGASTKIVKTSRSRPSRGVAIPVNAATRLPRIDAIIPRIGASITHYGLAVVRHFEGLGVVTTASSTAIALSRDKLHSLQVMSQAGLPIPRTAVIAVPEALYSAIHAVGGSPVVIKLIQGTQGRGVFLVPNLATAAAVFERLRGAKKQALVQEFVAEADGKDLRVIVVGNRCVAAMRRMAGIGEFRSNLHLGGSAVPVSLDNETEQLAIAAVRSHGLDVAGVDIIHSKRGPLLLEVNSSPGLEGIEGVTKVDLASEIVALLERAVGKKGKQRPSRQKRRRQR